MGGTKNRDEKRKAAHVFSCVKSLSAVVRFIEYYNSVVLNLADPAPADRARAQPSSTSVTKSSSAPTASAYSSRHSLCFSDEKTHFACATVIGLLQRRLANLPLPLNYQSSLQIQRYRDHIAKHEADGTTKAPEEEAEAAEPEAAPPQVNTSANMCNDNAVNTRYAQPSVCSTLCL